MTTTTYNTKNNNLFLEEYEKGNQKISMSASNGFDASFLHISNELEDKMYYRA